MSNRNPGYYQNRYPAIRCDFSPDDVDESNIGFAQGLTEDGIPFIAEKWDNGETVNATYYIPAIEDFDSLEGERLVDSRTGTGCFSFDVLMNNHCAVLGIGMIEAGYVDSLVVCNAYVSYLVAVGLVAFTTDYLNGSVTRLIDFDGNSIVSITVTLTEKGEELAYSDLVMIPFPQTGNKIDRHGFRVVK